MKDTKSIEFMHASAPDCKENYELHLNNWWRPCLQVIGIEGMPTNIENAGNVIYKELKFRMSMRLAPTHDSAKIVDLLKAKFTEKKDDTFGAEVEF